MSQTPTKDSSSVESLRNLIDDSVLESSSATLDLLSPTQMENLHLHNNIVMEGCLRRKTLLKNGKKPLLGNGAWQRFWSNECF